MLYFITGNRHTRRIHISWQHIRVKKLTKTEVDKLAHPQAGQKVYRDSEIKGFGVRVTSSGFKAYIVEKKVEGKTLRRVIGPTNVIPNEVARLEAQKLLLELSFGRDPKAIQAAKEMRAITLLELFCSYKTDPTRKLRPRSLAIYNDVMTRCLGDWHHKPVNEIDRSMVEDRLKKILMDVQAKRRTKPEKDEDDEKIPGQALAGQCYRLLKALVRYAQENYEVDGQPILVANPTRNLSRKKALDPECKALRHNQRSPAR